MCEKIMKGIENSGDVHRLKFLKNWCAKCLSYCKSLDNNSLQRSKTHTEALIKECDHLALWDEFGIVAQLMGVFKDHLVVWVEKYLVQTHGQTQADVILDDIDRRIAAVPAFSGLRRFPQGCNFQQWTGDDSKALMKYYEIFKSSEMILTFSLPRQDSMKHYHTLIRLFSAPNGLCSSITESKHIKAVKEPWRRSSCYKALGQMLVTNQCLDKLIASHQDFRACGMLNGTCLSSVIVALNAQTPTEEHHDDIDQQEPPAILPAGVGEDDGGADFEVVNDPMSVLTHVELAKTPQGTKHARCIPGLSAELNIPNLAELVQSFLFEQSNPNDAHDPTEVSLLESPYYRVALVVSAA
ncbi:hypothetical protein F4604DRAFT_1683910 [Suillus subluteus]|nr:hypothetical protein F4604DRAFT_1683910 [Suillus subluteus]